MYLQVCLIDDKGIRFLPHFNTKSLHYRYVALWRDAPEPYFFLANRIPKSTFLLLFLHPFSTGLPLTRRTISSPAASIIRTSKVVVNKTCHVLKHQWILSSNKNITRRPLDNRIRCKAFLYTPRSPLKTLFDFLVFLVVLEYLNIQESTSKASYQPIEATYAASAETSFILLEDVILDNAQFFSESIDHAIVLQAISVQISSITWPIHFLPPRSQKTFPPSLLFLQPNTSPPAMTKGLSHPLPSTANVLVSNTSHAYLSQLC